MDERILIGWIAGQVAGLFIGIAILGLRDRLKARGERK